MEFALSVRLGTNIDAQRAIRLLDRNSSDLARSFERLGSGMRINRASDDAAGLAIASRLNAEGRILGSALRNLGDAVSAINIVSSTLDQQTNVVTRLTELAEQAANGTISAVQRKSLDQEYQQLIKEYGRLGDTTTFNGLNLLRGNRSNGVSQLSFQAGLDGSIRSLLTLRSSDTGAYSGVFDLSRGVLADTSGDGGIDGEDRSRIAAAYTESELMELFSGNMLEVTTSTGRRMKIGLISTDDGSSFDLLAFEQGSDGKFLITAESFSTYLDYWGSGGGGPGGYSTDSNGKVIQANSRTFTSSTGGGTATLDISSLQFLTPAQAASNLIESTSVVSSDSALRALTVLAERLSKLSQIQSNYGAILSRIEAAGALAAVSREQRAGAESRIKDVDVAFEAAELTRKRILQDVGASVLAQANQAPALALKLL